MTFSLPPQRLLTLPLLPRLHQISDKYDAHLSARRITTAGQKRFSHRGVMLNGRERLAHISVVVVTSVAKPTPAKALWPHVCGLLAAVCAFPYRVTAASDSSPSDTPKNAATTPCAQMVFKRPCSFLFHALTSR